MNLVPELDFAPVEDDSYGFSNDEIGRIEDDVDSNQELSIPASSSDDEVEMTKDDLYSDKEAVPLPDGSSLEPNHVEQDVIPVAAQEVEDPFVAPPEEEIVPPFIFEDGGNADFEEVAVLCDEEDVLLYAELKMYNWKLPPYWLERVEVMRTVADDAGTHADELSAEYSMLFQGFEYDIELFQADQFSALAVNMIMHADEMDILCNDLFEETHHHCGNLHVMFLEHERFAIRQDFELVLEDSNRLKKIALGLRRCAACLTEWVQYHQHLLGEEEEPEEYHQHLLGEEEPEEYHQHLLGEEEPEEYHQHLLGEEEPEDLHRQEEPEEYHQHLLGEEELEDPHGEEEPEEPEVLPQGQEAAEIVLVEQQVKRNGDEDWWPENPMAVQPVKQQQPSEEEEEVPDSWEDLL